MLIAIKKIASRTFALFSSFGVIEKKDMNYSVLGKIQRLCTEGETMMISIVPQSQCTADVYRFFTTNPLLKVKLTSAELGGRLVAVEGKVATLFAKSSSRHGAEILKLCTLSTG